MFNRSDFIVGVLAAANVTLDGLSKTIVALGPLAGVLFTMMQVVVGGATVVYVLLKAWQILLSIRTSRRAAKRRRTRRKSRSKKKPARRKPTRKKTCLKPRRKRDY